MYLIFNFMHYYYISFFGGGGGGSWKNAAPPKKKKKKKTWMCHWLQHFIRVLHKHLPDCPGHVKVRFRQAFRKTKKWQLPESGKLKVYCGHENFNTKTNYFSFGGKWKCHWGKCFFCGVLYLYKWASGDKNGLCSTLISSCSMMSRHRTEKWGDITQT